MLQSITVQLHQLGEEFPSGLAACAPACVLLLIPCNFKHAYADTHAEADKLSLSVHMTPKGSSQPPPPSLCLRLQMISASSAFRTELGEKAALFIDYISGYFVVNSKKYPKRAEY